jgi:hypothetical protein
MMERRTFQQRAWPNTDEFMDLANKWAQSASDEICGYVWAGYEAFKREIRPRVGALTTNDLTLERSITQELTPFIKRCIPLESPYDVQHGRYETETLQSPQAQPPTYDISFFLAISPRLNFPVEAKVLPNDTSVSPYVSEITDNFLTCRYAPFSSEGIMLGYLISGTPINVFPAIAALLTANLVHHEKFPNQPHKYSDHLRNVPQGKPYPSDFRCQHIILDFT